MASSEKFCLRWNDFESNISVAFREIREEKDFFDCTLSCGSRQIQAHKLILSACSPFFRSILKQNPHQHPLLYLKGVEFTDLQSVLNFMYHGEVNVAQEELNSFLAVAEDLKVKGLTQNNSSDLASKPNPAESVVLANKPHPPKEPKTPQLQKRLRPIATPISQPAYQPQQEDIEEILPMSVVKTEPQVAPTIREEGGMMETMGMEMASTEDSYVEEGYDDYGGYEGQQEYYEGAEGQEYEGFGAAKSEEQNKGMNNYILRTETGYTCIECGKEFSDQSNCRRHVKNYHNKSNVSAIICEICQKCYKNHDSLRHHQRATHGLYKQ